MKARAVLIILFMSISLTDAIHDQLNGTVGYEHLNGTMAWEQFNGTMYWLSTRDVLVEMPASGGRKNLTVMVKANNFTMHNADGRIIPLNISSSFWQGAYTYQIKFDDNASGILRFHIPGQGQQFVSPMRGGDLMKIVLPEGFTTGERLLGIARPDPDQIEVVQGRTVLTWMNSSSRRFVEVGFYRETAPLYLKMAFTVIGFLALLVAFEYYYSIRRLRALREDL